MVRLHHSAAGMAPVDEAHETKLRPVMCFCTMAFRPTLLSLTPLNQCTRCDGMGWVEEHEFTGDDENDCVVCGWSKVAHWDSAKEV